MIQITIIKIINYGPWTLTLGSDREHELQMLQASLYKEMQSVFSSQNCLVFPNRFDEFFVITNGLDKLKHEEIKKSIESKFNLKLSFSIGYDKNPYLANKSTQKIESCDDVIINENDRVTIMHLDVNDLTARCKDYSSYDISILMIQLYEKMATFFAKHDSMTFFMGGDNFMVIAQYAGALESAKTFIDSTRMDLDIIFNCGIGTGRTARESANFATQSLDIVRKNRSSGKDYSRIHQLSCN